MFVQQFTVLIWLSNSYSRYQVLKTQQLRKIKVQTQIVSTVDIFQACLYSHNSLEVNRQYLNAPAKILKSAIFMQQIKDSSDMPLNKLILSDLSISTRKHKCLCLNYTAESQLYDKDRFNNLLILLQQQFNRNIMISSKSKSSLTIQTNQAVSQTPLAYLTNRGDKHLSSTHRKLLVSPKIKAEKNVVKQTKELNSRQTQQTQRSESKRQSYFLRKSILQLYNFFQSKKQSWNLHQLSYPQMLTLLKELKYIKCSEQSQKWENNQQLRKCYYLWLNISHKNCIKLANLIIFLTCIEKIESDCQLIEEIVGQLEKGIEKFPALAVVSLSFPQFLFYFKKQDWIFQRGLLKLNQKQINHIQKYFNSFLYTRLTQNQVRINLQPFDQPENHNFMSKKSVQLAEGKRKKILQSIKLRQPNMESIQLHHILNYKEQYFNSKEKPLKTQAFQVCQLNEKGKQVKKTLKVKTNPQIQHEKCQQKSKVKNKENLNNQAKGQKKPQKFKKKFKNETNIAKSSKTQAQPQINCKAKNQQQEQLFEQAIPFHPSKIMTQLEKLQFKQEEFAQILASQRSLAMPRQEKDREQKRRQYIDLPILYVDVNIEQGKKERIVVYEGDKARGLALQFGKVHNLPDQTVNRLEIMLQQQISSVLCKIDETFEQDCSYLY